MEVKSPWQSVQQRRTLIFARKHLFSDLRPYVCTFKECDVKLFADRHTWFDHELACHRLEWCCRFCSYPAFATQEKLAAHMRARHAQLSSPAQLPVLLHACRQAVDRVPAANCLLCDWESVLRQNNTVVSPHETFVVTLDQFRRHVGSHMEQLALFALPRSYQDHGAEGGSNEAAAAAGSNSTSLSSIGRSVMSWGSISSRRATQDQAVPDLAVDEYPAPLEIVTHSRTSESSLHAWSRSYLKRFPIHGDERFLTNCIKWTGAAVGQACSNRGDIYIHGGLVNGVKSDEFTYVIEMSEGDAIVSRINTSRGPSPRVNAAAVSATSVNAFIVFGGDTRPTEGDDWDTALYWHDIGILLVGFH